MRTRIFSVLVILLSLGTGAIGAQGFQLDSPGRGGASGGGTGFCSQQSNYLLCEDFEGSSSCYSGGSSNCQNTWSQSSYTTVTANYTTSPAPLDGNYSLYTVGSGTGSMTKTFTATSPVYSRHQFVAELLSLSSGSSARFFQIDDGAHTLCAAGISNVSGTYRLYVMNDSNNASGTTTSISASIDYCIWLDFVAGSSTSSCTAYIATATGSRESKSCSSKPGTAEVALTNQSESYNASRIQLLDFQGSVDQDIYDDILVKASAF
jgi:hypothetical protein